MIPVDNDYNDPLDATVSKDTRGRRKNSWRILIEAKRDLRAQGRKAWALLA